jgi:hypothetical protein
LLYLRFLAFYKFFEFFLRFTCVLQVFLSFFSHQDDSPLAAPIT